MGKAALHHYDSISSILIDIVTVFKNFHCPLSIVNLFHCPLLIESLTIVSFSIFNSSYNSPCGAFAFAGLEPFKE
jgi:hypothetical protein